MKKSIRVKHLIPLLLFCFSACGSNRISTIDTSPLRVHPDNPRYFTDNSGKAIYLTGSHTWANFQDMEISYDSITPFDFTGYLDFLQEYNHNFIRLWAWEHTFGASWAPEMAILIFGPTHPYPRTGPGVALDSLPKFDLSRFNQAHFDRLRSRVIEAEERGIYVMIMLFQGFSIEKKGAGRDDPFSGDPWWGHPFNQANNINGINGDSGGDGQGEEVHTLAVSGITGLQKAYIRKVVDTVNDLDNVLYEIGNECHKESTRWQYEMIDYIHWYEKSKPRQHPVAMTYEFHGGRDDYLYSSPAEAISPSRGENREYMEDPPASDGRKVILADTDHFWGIGGQACWVWKSFLRGLNPIFMDPLEPLYHCYRCDSEMNRPSFPGWEAIRKNMGYTLKFANRIDLVNMKPCNNLASSGYCLAKPVADDAEYLVYLPGGGTVSVDLSATAGELNIEWFDPASGVTTDIWTEQGGTVDKTFTAPFKGDAVLYISQNRE